MECIPSRTKSLDDDFDESITGGRNEPADRYALSKNHCEIISRETRKKRNGCKWVNHFWRHVFGSCGGGVPLVFGSPEGGGRGSHQLAPDKSKKKGRGVLFMWGAFSHS